MSNKETLKFFFDNRKIRPSKYSYYVWIFIFNNFTEFITEIKIPDIIRKTYNVDSIFRENYGAKDNQSNDYTIELPETINKAVTMSISSIEIPLSYHNISGIFII